MKLNELVKTNLDIEISGISCDSRKVKKGDLFIAISGYKTDGHKYAKAAETSGAACVIAEKGIEGMHIPVIVVKNSRIALAEAAHKFYYNPSAHFKLIGVTGTNGKTTVTYLLKSIFEKAGHKVGLIGTNQNMIGSEIIQTNRTTPDALELAQLFKKMADERCDYVVMEVSSHSLALNRVHMCHFEAAAFTNLTQDHLDFHKTMENYLAAKAKLFTMCKTAILNIDDDGGRRIAANVECKKITYGFNKSDIQAENIEMESDGVSFDTLGTRFKISIPGRFSVYNALCAISVAKAIGIDNEIIKEALCGAHGVKGRAEVYPTDKDFTIIIDYAHTPDGIENILNAVRGFAKGRVVVLFGCGGDRDTSKRPKMGKIAGELADFCIITSDNPRSEEPASIIRDILAGMENATADYVVIENRKDAIKYAVMHAQKDDVIVLAGKGHETYQILADKIIHFDEREVLDEILK